MPLATGTAAGASVAALYAARDLRVPIDVEALLPADLGLWPVSRPMAAWLACAVSELGRKSILEFGAGWSSLVLAKALAAAGGGRLTSVEHQPEYIRKDVWEEVQQTAGVDTHLVVAPLQRRLSTHGLLWSYRDVQRQLGSRAPYDLVFIDAPPARYGRTSPLHDAYPFLAAGAVVVLDDAARVEEQTVAKRWLLTYPGLELAVLDPDTARGVAVFVHDGDKRRRLAARAVAGSFRDQWRAFRARQRTATP